MAQIFRHEGGSALYDGLPASIAQVGGKVALRFTLYDYLKEILRRNLGGHHKNVQNLAADVLSGTVEAMVWTERIKVLQQNQMKTRANPLDTLATFRQVIHKQGIRGLWVGCLPTMYKQGASVGTRFWLYDMIKNIIT